MFNNGYNVKNELKSFTLNELQKLQEEQSFPFSVLLLNLTGDLNIGMIIRTCVLMGADKVHVLGRRRIDSRSLVGAQNYIDINRVWALDDEEEIDPDTFREYCESEDINPVLVEQGGTPLHKVDWFGDDIPDHPTFVFGTESEGIPAEIMDMGYPVLSIPQRGVMRSFNVSSAASIILWDYASYMGYIE